jgi:uncharacterized protein (TIGR02145 family)
LENNIIYRVSRLILFVIVSLFAQGCNKGDDTQTEKVIDIDGNAYHTVTIGTQVWMAENLKVTHYRNGDKIGTTSLATLDISEEVNPKYQWAYDGDERNVVTYGRLYTWYAITDNRNVCPVGWHIPTKEEMFELREYLMSNGFNYDGTTNGNACAKALASDSCWIADNTKGAVGNSDYPEKRNITGFNGLPGGHRGNQGIVFNDIGLFGQWWSSSEESDFAWEMSLHWSLPVFYISTWPKYTGLSVRCIQD